MITWLPISGIWPWPGDPRCISFEITGDTASIFVSGVCVLTYGSQFRYKKTWTHFAISTFKIKKKKFINNLEGIATYEIKSLVPEFTIFLLPCLMKDWFSQFNFYACRHIDSSVVVLVNIFWLSHSFLKVQSADARFVVIHFLHTACRHACMHAHTHSQV